MKLNTKFNLCTNETQQGADCAIWLNARPQEVVTALAVGSGPGVPGTNGTPTQGTIEPGHIVQGNSDGAYELATECDLSAEMPKLYFCVFAGNADFSFSGDIFIFVGGCFETEKFDATAYTPFSPLVVSPDVPGNLAPKLSATDNIKHCAYVGQRGLMPNGALDVIMPQTT